MEKVPLSAFPYVTVRLTCARCPRRGSYRLARLAAEHGPEVALTELLARLAGSCPHWNPPRVWQERCGAHYADLGGPGKPAPDEPPDGSGSGGAP